MREFRDIASFLKALPGIQDAVVAAEKRALQVAGEMVQREAKEEIGRPQEAAGPYTDWVPLSGATLEGFEHPEAGYIPGKIELGYVGHLSEEDPLLRTGDLRESIGLTVDGNTAVVGSGMDVAVWQEMGTPDALYPIPPRSFLGRALVRETDHIIEAVGSRVVWAARGMPTRND